MSWSKWLHIYLSMVSFAILFFFAITGVTLNHPDSFGDEPVTTIVEGNLDLELLGPDGEEDVARLDIVEWFRSEYKIQGMLDDFRVEEYECTLYFKGPGYSADIYIDRADGYFELAESRMGFVAVINDLHKGRDSGTAWSAVIDISAIVMCVVSLSGLTLIFFIKRKRFSGLLLAVAGLILCALIYIFMIP